MSAERPRRVDGLEVHEVEDGLVVYDAGTDRVHYLNASASVVFALCTGEHTSDDIATMLASAWQLPVAPRADVAACLDQLRTEGVLV